MPLIPIALALAPLVPDIVKWITGSNDAEAMAGKVVDIAKQVAGTDDAEQAAKAIQADPQLAIQFQTAVMANRVELQKLYFDDIKDQRARELEDVKSARERDIEFIRDNRRNLRADIMVLSVATGLIVCLATLVIFREDIPGEAIGIISTIAGIFGSCLKDAFTFEFGSSRGSQDKNITPERMIAVAKTIKTAM